MDIEFIKLESVGSTVCEYYKKPINENAGRELINLDIRQETAKYYDYSVNGSLCIKHNARDHIEWKASNFEGAVLIMLKQIVKQDNYTKSMNLSHSGYEPPGRNLRGIKI